MTKASHWANLKLMIYIHHFLLIAIAAVGVLCFCFGRYIGKTDSLLFLSGNDLRKQKWFISCSYNPNKSMMGQHKEADDDDELFLWYG